METAGYILLSVVVLGWLALLVTGIVATFPIGLIGLFVISGMGLLFIKVILERLKNKEDDYYEKNIDK